MTSSVRGQVSILCFLVTLRKKPILAGNARPEFDLTETLGGPRLKVILQNNKRAVLKSIKDIQYSKRLRDCSNWRNLKSQLNN